MSTTTKKTNQLTSSSGNILVGKGGVYISTSPTVIVTRANEQQYVRGQYYKDKGSVVAVMSTPREIHKSVYSSINQSLSGNVLASNTASESHLKK